MTEAWVGEVMESGAVVRVRAEVEVAEGTAVVGVWTQAKVIARVREVAEEKAGVELVTGGMEVVGLSTVVGAVAQA